MKVRDLMSRGVRTCLRTDSLNAAAQLMWENDCGCVAVVDDQGKLFGLITDRDICMAAYTRGRRLDEMTVESACSRSVVTIGPDETLGRAAELMRDAQVRRLAVIDQEGRLVGLLSTGDLARRAHENRTKSLALLRTLRDEVRVRLHLGGMDLKDQWAKLEPHLAEVERKAEEISDASRAAVADAVKRLQTFRASLAERG